MDLSSEEEVPVFVTQNKLSNSLSVESEYDTDNVIGELLVHSPKRNHVITI
jgi:hypothetical protein